MMIDLFLISIFLMNPHLSLSSLDNKNININNIGDTKCSVESVEYVNSKQLHSILQELTNTTYFRLWKANLERTCLFWQKDVPSKAPTPADTTTQHEVEDEEEDSGTCPGVPFSSLDGEGQSTCSVDMSEDETLKARMKWAPLTDAIDKRISTAEGEALTKTEDVCNDEPDNSPTFWLNICHDIDTETSSEYINLQLNPERNTYYNGSHVWQSIYEENCFIRSGSAKDMCYEERVLYRLLSGMHTSINIHI